MDRATAPEVPEGGQQITDVGVGNEEGDRKASLEVYRGRAGMYPDLVTPGGIRQEYPMYHKHKHLHKMGQANHQRAHLRGHGQRLPQELAKR